MATKILESAFPYMNTRTHTSKSPNSKPPKPKSKSGTSSPSSPLRPLPTRASSHPGPAPLSSPTPSPTHKAPARPFGTNYRVRRTPPGTPPATPPNGLDSPSSSSPSSIRDFAKHPSSAAHSQPSRRKPVYSMHEADPAAKGRPEVVYTHEELLRRLNTIGEDEDEEMERVRTGEVEREREWEEERRRKEEREMEEWNRREGRKGRGGVVRGFSWKGVKHVVGGLR